MEQRYWNKVTFYGNPSKKGVYDVILIYEEDGKKYATRESRYFADASHAPGWIMNGQPKEGMVWFEESGSYPNERVYAWLPEREYPDIDLPDDVEWKEEA